MKTSEVLQFVAEKIGMEAESLPDGGFFHGSENDKVEGILVTWMATCEALRAAIDQKLNLVICHEPPFFDEVEQRPLYRWTSEPDEKPSEGIGHPNRLRREILEEVGSELTLLQIHYGLDRLCIYEDFARIIGLGPAVGGGGYETVFALPQGLTIGGLAKKIAEKLNFKSIRIVGDPNKRVSCAGNLWGGVGLASNRYWMRKQIEYGADVLVGGEADEEAMFFAKEYGVGLIVTAHAVSENIGLQSFVTMLRAKFPHVPAKFYEVSTPFIDFHDFSV